MTLEQAQEFAENLLKQHGFWDRGWRFQWMRRGCTRMLGQCCYSKKLIRMNPDYVRLCDDGPVKDTILHEIAHVIAGNRGCYNHGHGWKMACLQVGANPQRLKNLSTQEDWRNWKAKKTQTKAANREASGTIRYGLVHQKTGEIFRCYGRRPNAETIAKACRLYIVGRKFETVGHLRIRPIPRHKKVGECVY